MIRKSMLYAALLIIALVGTARGGLTISIGNLNLSPGGSGMVDVSISNTGRLPVDLDNFAFRFQITTQGQSQLAFTPIQPMPFGRSDYLFFRNSLDEDAGIALGQVTTTLTPFDTYIGGDNTSDGGEVLLSGTKFLASLNVTALTAVMPNLGDTFTIDLAAADSQGSPTTYFGGDSGDIPYSVVGGQVQIVPEPSSWAMLATGGLSAFLMIRAKRPLGQRVSGPRNTANPIICNSPRALPVRPRLDLADAVSISRREPLGYPASIGDLGRNGQCFATR